MLKIGFQAVIYNNCIAQRLGESPFYDGFKSISKTSVAISLHKTRGLGKQRWNLLEKKSSPTMDLSRLDLKNPGTYHVNLSLQYSGTFQKVTSPSRILPREEYKSKPNRSNPVSNSHQNPPLDYKSANKTLTRHANHQGGRSSSPVEEKRENIVVPLLWYVNA